MLPRVHDNIANYVPIAVVKAVERHYQVELDWRDVDECWEKIVNTDLNVLRRYKGVGPASIRKVEKWIDSVVSKVYG
tara:strand:- start:87 stop:317 length:231 start_codon:yes stop_codon:yes gene_type:complete